MKKLFFALVFIFSFSSQASTGRLSSYQALIQRTLAKGEPMDPKAHWRTISRTEPGDPQANHNFDSFTVLGAIQNQKIVPLDVSMVSEKWQRLPNGDWQVEQWNWAADVDGVLTDVSHYMMTKAPDGWTRELDTLPNGEPADPAEVARWNAKLQEWYELEKH